MEMRPSVYVESSVVSYLGALPSRDLLVAAHQQVTHAWWRSRRMAFDVFVSQLVIDECAAGDPEAAKRRAVFLAGLPLLDVVAEVTDLARHLAQSVPMPPRAAADALHIALATFHGMDYLLTWNCTHIANAELRQRIDQACTEMGYTSVVLCTPEELLGGEFNE
jgi:hypothetical protein